MRQSHPGGGRRIAVAALLLVAWGCGSAGAGSCDRACLQATLDRYLDAVFAHRPGDAPLAAAHRATLNAAPLADGAGVWQALLRRGAVGRQYVDVRTGQAAYYGLLEQADGPAIASVRVRVAGRRIVEAEWTLATARDGGMFSADGLLQDPPPLVQRLPRGERMSRERMIAAADAYFSALQRHDGADVPHVAGCERVENGVRVTHRPRGTAPLPPLPGAATPGATPGAASGAAPSAAQEELSGDCVAGFEAFEHSIAATVHRRYPLVDEEAGVVMGTTLFHRPPGSTLRRNLLTEYFHVRDGRIAAIYAAMYYLAPDAPDSTGW
ncbi:MAG: hypothetical protein U1F30_05300 [Steroidobacteraceae bacterium]